MKTIYITIAIILHLISVVIWVGGMFFAHTALRPAATSLSTELRIPLWGRIFEKFFPWVWTAVLIIFVTGYSVLFLVFTSFKDASPYVHAMIGLGNLMSLLFFYLWFFPYQSFRTALATKDLATAGFHQTRIRYIITINLVLGLITIVVAVIGHW
ncbi:CopD domain-containing protein [Gammaproteobacteria bacterium]